MNNGFGFGLQDCLECHSDRHVLNMSDGYLLDSIVMSYPLYRNGP